MNTAVNGLVMVLFLVYVSAVYGVFYSTNHPQYPVSQARLSALNRYLKEKVEELLKIPVADEKELQKKMNKELERIRNSTN